MWIASGSEYRRRKKRQHEERLRLERLRHVRAMEMVLEYASTVKERMVTR